MRSDVVILLDSITRLLPGHITRLPRFRKSAFRWCGSQCPAQTQAVLRKGAREYREWWFSYHYSHALIDTGSKMDEVIFEEFKGTGNMELQLDRNCPTSASTRPLMLRHPVFRRDDLLHDRDVLQRMWILRNHLADMNTEESSGIPPPEHERHQEQRRIPDFHELLINILIPAVDMLCISNASAYLAVPNFKQMKPIFQPSKRKRGTSTDSAVA